MLARTISTNRRVYLIAGLTRILSDGLLLSMTLMVFVAVNLVYHQCLIAIAFKTLIIMPNLLLQLPSKSSKAKNRLKALERRLELWKQGSLNELVYQVNTI